MKPPENIGKIRIQGVLARGGMGDVYVGYDEKLARRVALKALRYERSRDPGSQAWLLREARILSRLDHPNICRIYDFLEHDGRDFLVLEYIEGRTLRSAVLAGEVSEKTRMQIALDIAGVLAATHGEGLIHRDLKPDNVMLTASGKVKVLDFGVARAVGASEDELRSFSSPREGETAGGIAAETPAASNPLATIPGRVPGTPHFMSPEQARREHLTVATDLYSFGLLLQFLFTGEFPHPPGLTEIQLLLRAANNKTRPLRNVEADLGELIERLKSSEPATRPTAFDTLLRLERIRDKPRRRARRAVMVAVFVMTAALAGIMSFQTFRISQIARQAEEQARLALSRQLTAQASAALETHLDRALLLALEAHRTSPTPEARDVLLRGLEIRPWLGTILRSGADKVQAVAWNDDDRILAAAAATTIRLFDTATWEEVGELTGHKTSIWALDWSEDGTTLATGSSDGEIRLWDAETQAPRGPTFAGHTDQISRLVWSGDGRTLASCGRDLTVRLWDTATGRQRGAPVALRSNAWSLAWSGDGRTLAFTEDDDAIRLLDPATGRGASLTHPDGYVWALAWSPDSRLLAVGGDHRIRFWDAAAGRFGAPIEGSDSPVQALAWSRDGRLLAAAENQVVRLFDTASGASVGEPLRGPADTVIDLAWSGDGRRLAAASLDGSVLLWNVSADQVRGQVLLGHRGWVMALSWSRDGRILASGSVDETALLWDAVAGRSAEAIKDHEAGVWAVAWNADGSVLATSGEDRTIRLWTPRGAALRTLDGPRDAVIDLAWNGDGTTLAAAAYDGALWLFDPRSGALQRQIETGHDALTGTRWSANGETLFSIGSDSVLRFLSPRTGEALREPVLTGQGWLSSLAVSPDGQLLATGARDGSIRLWDAAGGEAKGEPLSGHLDEVSGLAWSADGRRLASAGKDGVIVVWDRGLRRAVGRLRSHQGSVTALEWHPRESFLASGGADQKIVVRDLRGDLASWKERACRRARRNLTTAEWAEFLGPEIPYRRTCPSLF